MSNTDFNLVMGIGAVIFVAIWAYGFYQWGILKGLMLGWIPSLIGAGLIVIGGALLLPH